MRAMTTNKPKNKSFYACLYLASAAVLVFACFAILFLAPDRPGPPAPTRPPISDLDYFAIRLNWQSMTGVQWEAYDKSARGKRIQWRGYIQEVKPDITGTNYVWVDMEPDGEPDVYFAYPEAQSLDLFKGQPVTFRGDYAGGAEIIFFLIKLENADFVR